ncbi:MAG: hypothetical protein AAGJ37_15685 [Pseudomonadota bacterium]
MRTILSIIHCILLTSVLLVAGFSHSQPPRLAESTEIQKNENFQVVTVELLYGKKVSTIAITALKNILVENGCRAILTPVDANIERIIVRVNEKVVKGTDSVIIATREALEHCKK